MFISLHINALITIEYFMMMVLKHFSNIICILMYHYLSRLLLIKKKSFSDIVIFKMHLLAHYRFEANNSWIHANNNNNNNDGYYKVLFLRTAHSPFIKVKKKRLNIELWKTNRIKLLCMMPNHTWSKQCCLCVNKPWQSMKTRSICWNQLQKKKALCKQTALDKGASNIK